MPPAPGAVSQEDGGRADGDEDMDEGDVRMDEEENDMPRDAGSRRARRGAEEEEEYEVRGGPVIIIW
jgi:hypothetical protein